jgi:hypothetical protein
VRREGGAEICERETRRRGGDGAGAGAPARRCYMATEEGRRRVRRTHRRRQPTSRSLGHRFLGLSAMRALAARAEEGPAAGGD